MSGLSFWVEFLGWGFTVGFGGFKLKKNVPIVIAVATDYITHLLLYQDPAIFNQMMVFVKSSVFRFDFALFCYFPTLGDLLLPASFDQSNTERTTGAYLTSV